MESIIRADFRQLASLFDSVGLAGMSDFFGIRIYADSARTSPEGVRYLAFREPQGDGLLVRGKREGLGGIPAAFIGELMNNGEDCILIAPQNPENIHTLLELFPELAPVAIGSEKSSFGLGDRLGIASPGHIQLFTERSVVPVLAQQSLRELDLMGRQYRDVIDAAVWAVFCTGYRGPWVADGDHLKEVDAVVSALEQGCTMITADLSEHLAFQYMTENLQSIEETYGKLDTGWRNHLESRYRGAIYLITGEILHFDHEKMQRIALIYGRALDHAVDLFRACSDVSDKFDFEISIDETDIPTTPEAHYFVAKELAVRNVNFTSLAPRFVGEFQKGIDYIGDTEEFALSFEIHAAIAGELGHKISIHSSSDKFSVYPIIGKLVAGAFHLKTSGTNWLVALETIARVDPGFFRELFNRAYEVFPIARNYYHITPDMGIATDLAKVDDAGLTAVFSNPTDRQVLHVSYGEMFKDAQLKKRFFECLRKSIEAYWDALKVHIGRHLELLEG